MSNYSHFDHLFDAVLVIDDNGEVIYNNHQANIFFKLSPRLLKQQKTVKQICQSSDLDLEGWLKQSLAKNEVTISSEISLKLSQDESQCFTVIKCVPLSSHTAVIFHDITVEKNLHIKYREQLEELKKTHAQILQADKLKTLGEVTATISHEINNPLTIAAGHCEIIDDMLKVPHVEKLIPKILSANQTVSESLQRVNQIIKNMKDFLHQSEEEKEYCDLETVVESAIDWIRPTAKNIGVEILKEVHSKSVALANRVKLEQVIINLIKNSIDALSDSNKADGTILIRVSKSDQDHQTFIDVIDNGPGIRADIKMNLFKPFQSTKDSGNGTGLGLSICQKIIESHRGQIEHLDSQSGCHFRIRIPLIEIYSYTRNDKSLSGAKAKKKILVLDNEVQILNVLNSFILEEGLVFIGSSDPKGSLDFLDKADVDLILTDFSMPQMDGGEFALKARESGYSGPILYMTSSKNVEQYNKDKASINLSGLIVKPFTKEDVIKTIRGALNSSR